MAPEWGVLLLLVLSIVILAFGFPVAFSLAGSALFTAGVCYAFGIFDASFLSTLPERFYGIMLNDSLVSIPLFVLMGMVLEKTRLAEDLLKSMARILKSVRGGLGLSVFLVGALLAASTGVVGATVVAMGLISLPEMLKNNYSKPLAAGIVCASGTLCQIIPPSIVLIVLGDVISSAHQQAQLSLGNYSPTVVSVADLFVGALLPGMILVGVYMIYLAVLAFIKPELAPKAQNEKLDFGIFKILLPPLLLVVFVLGSILFGVATPTEAAGVGVMGALLIAFSLKRIKWNDMKEALSSTVSTTAMVFTILLGANIFSIVFRGLHGDDIVQNYLLNLSGGPAMVLFTVMLVIFVMGFFVDFFEIVFIVMPIVGPALLQLGYDPVWLGVIVALNLQTSFLTPPFGFSLFYLRGVAPPEVKTTDIYKGVLPFIFLQIFVMLLVIIFPKLILRL